MSIVSKKPRAVSLASARVIAGLTFIVCGFIVATEIALLGIQTNSVLFNVGISLSTGFFTSGLVLAVEAALEHAAHWTPN